MALIAEDPPPKRGYIKCPGMRVISASPFRYRCGENNHRGGPPDKRKSGRKLKRVDSSHGIKKFLRALRKIGDQWGEKPAVQEVQSRFPHKISYKPEKNHEEACDLLITFLRRLHPMEEANGLSIGAILRQMSGDRKQIEWMFRYLLAADKFEDIRFRILNLVPFLKDQDISVDYDRLYWDLWYWHHPSTFVQFFWSLPSGNFVFLIRSYKTFPPIYSLLTTGQVPSRSFPDPGVGLLPLIPMMARAFWISPAEKPNFISSS